MIKGDPYTLVVRVPRKPKAFTVLRVEFDGQSHGAEQEKGICRVTFTPDRTGVVFWRIWFQAE